MRWRFGVLIALGILASCAQSPWQYRLQEALQADFASQAEFEQSPLHPRALIQDVLSQDQDPVHRSKEFCQKLQDLGTKAVVYLSEEIQQHPQLIQACQSWVQEQLSRQTREWVYELERTRQSLLSAPVDTKEFSRPVLTSRNWVYDTQETYTGSSFRAREVLLTFDDGPHPVYSLQIGQALQQARVTGVFFLVGRNVSNYPRIVKQMAQLGHLMANHSETHPCMGCTKGGQLVTPFEVARREFRITHEKIFTLLGWVEPMIRFPYGSSTAALRGWVAENHLANMLWNVDSLDWKPNQSPAQVLIRTVRQLRAQGRGILLFHDIHQRTALLIPELLEILAAEGYVTLNPVPKNPELRQQHPLLGGRKPSG